MTRTGFALALRALTRLGLPPAPLARAQSPFEVSPEPRLADTSPRAGSVLATPPSRLQAELPLTRVRLPAAGS
ncbi:MAG TPA: hypothetical protein VK066_15925 [Chloroflexota bacterium]|nr:hypothetical protein [Chloroflexota bacterium]